MCRLTNASCVVVTRLTVTDSDGAQNFTFADATVLKGWMHHHILLILSTFFISMHL